MEIKEVTIREQKAEYCKEILLDLSEWFGIPESTQEYIQNSMDELMWIAVEDNQLLGMICITPTSKDCFEVSVMGVKKNYHRTGIGTRLIETVISYISSKQIPFIQVKTLDASKKSEGY